MWRTQQHRLPVPTAPQQWQQGVQSHAQPYAGIAPTIRLIHQQADRLAHSPEVRAIAETITRALYGKDYLSELAAIYYWHCDPRNIRYMRDPHRVELVKDTHVILQTKQADCDEYDVSQKNFIDARRAAWTKAVHLAGAASSAGNIEVEPVLTGFQPTPNMSHTFVRVKDPRGSGRHVVMDPVAGPLTPRMLRQIKHFQAAGAL